MPIEAARFPAQEVYDRAAAEIGEHLAAGRDVAVLCEGDPFFYGSFMYLFGRMAGRFPVQVVPGVSSLTAAAAVSGSPLAARTRSEEHTSELQSLMRISYAVFCLKKKK